MQISIQMVPEIQISKKPLDGVNAVDLDSMLQREAAQAFFWVTSVT